MDKQDGEPTDLEHLLTDIAVEGWRFARVFARVLNKMDAGEGSRYVNQHRYYLKRLEENLEQAGMRFVDLEGSAYDPGLAATALNLGDFEPDDCLLVDHMVEPIVMGRDGIVRVGTVVLRKTRP